MFPAFTPTTVKPRVMHVIPWVPDALSRILSQCNTRDMRAREKPLAARKEGTEGVKWELGFAYLILHWEMGFEALGLGFGDWKWEIQIQNGNGKDL